MIVPVDGARRFSLRMFLNIAAVAVALPGFFMGRELIEPPFVIAFAVLLAVSVVIERGGIPRPPRFLINLATLGAIALIVLRVRRDYIVEAFLEAILLMTGIRMLEKERPRDYVQIALLALAMLVTYAMLSVEKTFVVYCFGIILICTLILMFSTWLAEDREARISLREAGHIVFHAATLFVMMLPLCLLLFFAAPRAARPFFGLRSQYGGSATGFSDQVQLGDATSIQTSKRLAFRAVMNPLPDYRTPYWRGLVLDIFEGNLWIASRISRGRGDFIPEKNVSDFRQEIHLEPGNRGVLFALDQPLAVTGTDAVALGNGTYRHRGAFYGRRLSYQALSVLSSRMVPAVPDGDKRRWLALPAGFIPRLRNIVDEMTQGMSDRQKAEAIMNWLAPPAFEYSLEGMPENSRNALETFLFSGRKGNCEYFASAMGVMLRMAGVPARLVTGYRGGIYNEAGGYYIVQEDSAHVWVEAWDEELGAWVRRDPTPATGTLGSTGLNFMELWLDMLDYHWSRLIVNYNWEIQAETIRSLREILRNPRASLSPDREDIRRMGTALYASLTVLGGIAACFLLFYLLRHLRNRRPEIVLLRRFDQAAKRLGYEREKSEGLEEFMDRVDDPEFRELASPFVRRFEEFYYRDRPLDPETRRFLRKETEKIRATETPD